MKHATPEALFRNAIGFDQMDRLMRELSHQPQRSPNYPPFDIEKVSESEYRVTLAVAGFKPDELSVETEEGELKITGSKSEDQTDRTFLHRGIATRDFDRRFRLADYVRVTGANASDGILTVDLVRELPEAQKPRTIEINAG